MSEISSLKQNLIFKKIDTETINVQINHNPTLMAIVGEFNKNLKELEKITCTNIFFRGNSITCKGKTVNLEEFTHAIKFLVDKYFLTKVIEKEDIILSVKKNMKFKESNIKSFSFRVIQLPPKTSEASKSSKL